MMSKKRKITKEMLLSATGRKPSQPELPEQPGEMLRALKEKDPEAYAELENNNTKRVAFVNEAADQFFIEVLTGKRAPAAQGRFRSTSGQMQNIPRGTLVDADYEKLERLVAASPAFAAPYGQTNKDNADE